MVNLSQNSSENELMDEFVMSEMRIYNQIIEVISRFVMTYRITMELKQQKEPILTTFLVKIFFPTSGMP